MKLYVALFALVAIAVAEPGYSSGRNRGRFDDHHDLDHFDSGVQHRGQGGFDKFGGQFGGRGGVDFGFDRRQSVHGFNQGRFNQGRFNQGRFNQGRFNRGGFGNKFGGGFNNKFGGGKRNNFFNGGNRRFGGGRFNGGGRRLWY